MDKRADIVAASSTVIPTAKFQTESFFYRYLRELKKQRAKFDAVSVHLYPVNPKQGPDARVASIAAVRQVMRRVGLNKPLWDTEVNFGDRRNAAAQVVPKPKKAATYVARTYLDSAQYGIARTFWYGWDINVLGISTTNPDGSATRAGTRLPQRARLDVRRFVEGLQDQGHGHHVQGRQDPDRLLEQEEDRQTAFRGHPGMQTDRQVHSRTDPDQGVVGASSFGLTPPPWTR